MKKLFLLLVFTMCQATIIFALDTLRVETQIKEVTIFFDGAQIQREALLKSEKGSKILLISGLPADLVNNSLQVKSVNACKILSVKTSTTPVLDSKKEKEILDIEKQIESKSVKIKDYRNKIEVFQREERILLDNSKLVTDQAGIKITDLKEAADFFRLRLNEIKAAILKIEQDIKNTVDEIYKLYNEQNKLKALKEKKETKLYITIDVEKSISDKLVFSYYIKKAKWTPSYDFRVSDVNEPLTLVYQAIIYQTSGEDWKDVKIKLSASNPALGGEKPELPVWDVNRPIFQTKETTKAIYNFDGSLIGGNGAIQGKIRDLQTNEPIPFANIIIEKEGRQISGTSSDIDGKFIIKPLPTGLCNLKASFVGYKGVIVSNVIVSGDQITFCNFEMNPSVEMLSSVEVKGYSVPLIQKDQATTSGTITSEEIKKMPGRSAESVAVTVGGVFSSDGNYGEIAYSSDDYARGIRGARTEGTVTYIDGVRVRGASSIPQSAIDQVTQLTGGISSQYGEATYNDGGKYRGNSTYPQSSRYYNAGNSSQYNDANGSVVTTDLVKNILSMQVANIEYEIESPYTILCDGEDYLIRIKESKIPVDYVYYVVPKKDKDAFLVANITDWTALNLIDGKTSVYFQGTFVGESYLNTQVLKDTLSVSLGRDKGIFVQRNYKKEITERVVFGSNIKQSVGWNISVKNNKKYPVKVIIEENYPLSELKSVDVELIETSKGKLDDKTGKISWDLNLGVAETKNILFNYSIKYPKTQRIFFD